MQMSLIYLDKRDDESDTSAWEYYRVTSTGIDTIQICRVTFPSFEDKETPIDTPGNMGLAAAFNNVNWALLGQWNVDRPRSILIGVIAR